MTTIAIWLLVSVSYHSNNSGNLTVAERFPDVAACTHVLESLPLKANLQAQCIEAKVVLP